MNANKDILAKHPWRKGANFHLKLSIWKERGYSHLKDTKETHQWPVCDSC